MKYEGKQILLGLYVNSFYMCETLFLFLLLLILLSNIYIYICIYIYTIPGKYVIYNGTVSCTYFGLL